MAENEIDYVETAVSQIRYNIPLETKKLDSKKLQEELPEIYEQYSYTSERKGFISVKIKKGSW